MTSIPAYTEPVDTAVNALLTSSVRVLRTVIAPCLAAIWPVVPE